jgi:hypothetical protein
MDCQHSLYPYTSILDGAGAAVSLADKSPSVLLPGARGRRNFHVITLDGARATVSLTDESPSRSPASPKTQTQ